VVWTAALLVSARPEGGAWRGRFSLSMRYDVDRRHGSRFPVGENARQELLPPDAIAIWYGSRCGGRVGQCRRHDQEGGVSIVGEGGSAARTTRSLASRLLLPIVRSTCSGIRTSASIRGLHPPVHCRTPCGFSRRTRNLAHHLRSRRKRPTNARTSYAFAVTRGWVRAPAAGSPRARICSTDFYTCACGGLEDSAKIAKYSDEWYLSPPHRVGELARKASTHRYLSFDPVTEHIASEMRLVLHSDKGKAGVFCGALPRLAVRCLPPARPPAQSRMAWRGVAWRGQHRSRSGSPAQPCFRALGWSITPPTLPTSDGLSGVGGSRRTR
jgi:hypothetical protein